MLHATPHPHPLCPLPSPFPAQQPSREKEIASAAAAVAAALETGTQIHSITAYYHARLHRRPPVAASSTKTHNLWHERQDQQGKETVTNRIHQWLERKSNGTVHGHGPRRRRHRRCQGPVNRRASGCHDRPTMQVAGVPSMHFLDRELRRPIVFSSLGKRPTTGVAVASVRRMQRHDFPAGEGRGGPRGQPGRC